MAETFTWFAVVIIIAVAPASAGGVLVAKAYSPLLRSMGFWSIGLGALVLLLGFLVWLLLLPAPFEAAQG